MPSTDDNTEEIIDDIKGVSKFLYDSIIKSISEKEKEYYQKKCKKDMDYLKKENPSKIKSADIEKEDIDKFLKKAKEKDIECFEIITEKDNIKQIIPTLKYSIDDEHIITDIFKEMQLEKEIGTSKDELFIDIDTIDDEKILRKIEELTKTKINREDFHNYINNNEKGKSTIKDLEKEVKNDVEKENNRYKEERVKNKNIEKER